MSNTITTGSGEYTMYTFTGKVVGSSKNLETKVHGGGGGGMNYRGTGGSAPVRITSTTVIHDEIFLEDSNGKERALQLQGFNLASREGNVLTALWMIKNGAETGPYVVMHNHTTSQTFYQDQTLGKIFVIPKNTMIKRCAIVCGAIGLLGGIQGVLIGAAIGAGLGLILKVPSKKEIAKFKSTLSFPTLEMLQQNKTDMKVISDNSNMSENTQAGN